MTDSFNGNLYYAHERLGLTKVGELEDPEACYSFSTVAVYKENKTGALYGAHSEGCSCPTPFEEFDSLADMVPIRSEADVQPLIDQSSASYRADEVQDFKRRVREALNAHDGAII